MINHEQIQALKEQAECVCGILENIAGYEPDDIDGDDVELRFETEDGFDTGCNVSIVEQCQKSADVIRYLLAERDADKELIADLEQKHCGGALIEREEHHVGVVNKLLERIAELEAALNLASASYAGERERADALQARTLTVKLPRDITHVTNKYFEEGRDAVLEAIESQLAAAGITLVVGE